MTHLPDGDHDRGLHFDLQEIARQRLARRQAISWFGMAAAAPLIATALPAFAQGRPGMGGPGRGGPGHGSGSSSSSSSNSSSNSSSSSSASSGTCVADPTETSGPYPADGTNTASGSTSNILTQSGIVRSDIRSSFISSTTTAQGVKLVITLTLVNASSSCAPLSGYAVYLWHCDASGYYSLYSVPLESYLRGVQVTDSNGQVTFTTIFPACYSGRWPHIHIEIFKSLSAATSGKAAALTTQLAMPSSIASAVYSGTTYYSGSTSNLASISLSSDNVFGDDTSVQIVQMTPAFAGSVSAGYNATNTIGIAV